MTNGNLPARVGDSKDDQKKLFMSVSGLLTKYKPQIERILPKHVTADRLLQFMMNALITNPDLLNCSRASLIRCLLQGGALGLELNGPLGEAWIIPFNTKMMTPHGEKKVPTAQFVIGYPGYTKLARNSGLISRFDCNAVFEGEEFDYALGTEPFIKHRPTNQCFDPKVLRATYTIVWYKDGGNVFKVCELDEIKLAQKRSRAGSAGPWMTDFIAMGMKTSILRMKRILPLSREMAVAMQLDEALEGDRPQEFDSEIGEITKELDEEQSQVAAVTSRTAALTQELKDKKAKETAASAAVPPQDVGTQPESSTRPTSPSTEDAGVHSEPAPAETDKKEDKDQEGLPFDEAGNLAASEPAEENRAPDRDMDSDQLFTLTQMHRTRKYRDTKEHARLRVRVLEIMDSKIATWKEAESLIKMLMDVPKHPKADKN